MLLPVINVPSPSKYLVHSTRILTIQGQHVFILYTRITGVLVNETFS